MNSETTQKHVFLSYSSKDRNIAQGLAHALEKRGIPVWQDQDLPAGGDFASAIEKALTGSCCVIVLWSSNSVNSRWVRNEADWAAENEILLPVLIEGVEIPWEFLNYHTLDMKKWVDNDDDPALGALLLGLSQISKKSIKPDLSQHTDSPKPPTKHEEPSQSSTLPDVREEPTPPQFSFKTSFKTFLGKTFSQIKKNETRTFISYRRNNGAILARLIQCELKSLGVVTFLDVENLGAAEFDDQLFREIKKAKNFILILTSGSLDNCEEETDWLTREIQYALEIDRNIVPILGEGFEFDSLKQPPGFINMLQRHNAIGFSHEHFGSVMNKLIRFLVTE